MQSRLLVLSLLGVTACATAGGGTGGDDDTPADDDGTVTPDANPQQPPDAEPIGIDAGVPDAMPIDAAPPMPVTLTQNNAMNLVDGNSVACSDQLTLVTAENSYYRVFKLVDEGVTGQFTAKTLQFGIEMSTAQTVEVKLYTLSGTFTVGHLTPLSTQNVAIPAVAQGAPALQNVTLTSPVVVAPGSQLVAEVHILDGAATSAKFFIGSNTAGESGASYLRAPECGASEPATMASLSHPTVHMVLTVSGTTP